MGDVGRISPMKLPAIFCTVALLGCAYPAAEPHQASRTAGTSDDRPQVLIEPKERLVRVSNAGPNAESLLRSRGCAWRRHVIVCDASSADDIRSDLAYLGAISEREEPAVKAVHDAFRTAEEGAHVLDSEQLEAVAAHVLPIDHQRRLGAVLCCHGIPPNDRVTCTAIEAQDERFAAFVSACRATIQRHTSALSPATSLP